MYPIFLIGAAALLVRSFSNDDEDDTTVLSKRRLFISHSWKYSSTEYNKFVSKLKYETEFYNHSIPQSKAFSEWERDSLRKIFRQQMSGCQKVFVLAHSKVKRNSYVGVELEIAAEMGKDIVIVRPYGQQKIPSFIKQYSNTVIANNITSIVKVLQS